MPNMPNLNDKHSSGHHKQDDLKKDGFLVDNNEGHLDDTYCSLMDSYDDIDEETIEFATLFDETYCDQTDSFDDEDDDEACAVPASFFVCSTYDPYTKNDLTYFVAKRRVSVMRRKRYLYCLLVLVVTLLLVPQIAIGIHCAIRILHARRAPHLVLGNGSSHPIPK
jgi:hypothetical protein